MSAMFDNQVVTMDPGSPGLSVIQGGRLHLRTLIMLRWVAAVGQTATVLIVYFGLGFDFPVWFCLGAIAALVVSNAVLARRGRGRPRIRDREAVFLLGFDVVQLSVLLYLTGGLANPFVILIIAPAMVSATILSRAATIGLILLAAVCISLLGRYHLPLPWSGWPIELEPTYLLGIWTALAVAVVFIATFVWSVSEEARRMSDALAAAQSSLAREQRVSALGGLAAAAAHELGSPLATIAVIAKDLSQEVGADEPMAEDVALLLSQSERCQEIIAGLAHAPESAAGDGFGRLALSDIVAAAREPYLQDRSDIAIEIVRESDGGEPEMVYGPEVLHGLGNLIQNALQFANTKVTLSLSWTENEIVVGVRDDGAGFSPAVLATIGDPYISTRSGDGEHLGLGIFIAQTLLQRTGAELTFRNRDGAEVVIRWPRDMLGDSALQGEAR
jgi:two-component system sensor histidine kinase RegB